MYVIINGVSSETLQGVQILSLPPITKPRMRTSIATIDGRPGDIVTRLGYEAYNRKIEVLLHHNYDIAAVTAFFNSSGRIIFSNEPDMVYTFETIDAFDFERAVRFKTGAITFHVQPYKSSNSEQPAVSAFSPMTLNNRGNTESAPSLVIAGSGDVEVTLDGLVVFNITMPASGEIIIDSEALDAYDNDGNLANRSVTGSYEDIMLTPGEHTLAWTGAVTSVTVRNISRWI